MPLELPIKTRVGGTESKENLSPAQLVRRCCGAWVGVYGVSVQTAGDLTMRCCQGIPAMSAEAEHGTEAGREDFLSAAPPLHLTPDRGPQVGQQWDITREILCLNFCLVPSQVFNCLLVFLSLMFTTMFIIYSWNFQRQAEASVGFMRGASKLLKRA